MARILIEKLYVFPTNLFYAAIISIVEDF